MPAPEIDEEREERLAIKIVADCYNEHEVRPGWWCHLEGKLSGPFQAECIRVRRGWPVKIEWRGRKLRVPLAQLTGVAVAAETPETIADWHYGVAQARHFRFG